MVVFDTSVMGIAFDEHPSVPLDPSTAQPLTQAKARIDYLLKVLGESQQRVMLPTPAIAEYIVKGGPDKEKRIEVIVNSKAFVVAAFDLRAAIECALIEDADTARGTPLTEQQTKAKVKYDRQIIATAIARGASTIYTGDKHLAARAKASGVDAVLTWELPLPPKGPQSSLDFGMDAEPSNQTQ